MKIIFNPPDNKENQYINLMVAPLRASGFEIYALDDFFSSYKHFKSIDLVHLNWFENVDDSSFFVALRSFFRKMVVLLAIRLFKKPLVWTMHNRSSHEKGLRFFSRTLNKLLIKWADRIIIHSHISRHILIERNAQVASKIVYLPHPNFIDVYGPILPGSNDSSGILNLLFIGVVKPYKNIELLIKLAKEFKTDLILTIAGKPASEKYGRALEEIGKDAENLNLQLRFIEDTEIPDLFREVDLLVLPYDLESSLNSGTVILAFSYGKTVICPLIGTLDDMQEVHEDILTYRYNGKKEHEAVLRRTIANAINLKKAKNDIFKEKGVRLFHYVQQRHNNQQIGKELISIYKSFKQSVKKEGKTS
ncbi:glycosyltransferase [Olivibacter sp. CPCC 100613]|uniref:glycosyltransferase n=1 Tax=Olivibacter sp. CPCC 100613 TaxID=3079931 RepID=UPI002FFC20D1